MRRLSLALSVTLVLLLAGATVAAVVGAPGRGKSAPPGRPHYRDASADVSPWFELSAVPALVARELAEQPMDGQWSPLRVVTRSLPLLGRERAARSAGEQLPQARWSWRLLHFNNLM